MVMTEQEQTRWWQAQLHRHEANSGKHLRNLKGYTCDAFVSMMGSYVIALCG
jgi:hypothetical protein